MKKNLCLFFVLAMLSTTVFAQSISSIETQTQSNINVVYQEHSINMPTYITNGLYTYMFDRFGTMLGYFRKTPSGKIIAYDNFGNKKCAYKKTPGGYIAIYNAEGNKIN